MATRPGRCRSSRTSSSAASSSTAYPTAPSHPPLRFPRQRVSPGTARHDPAAPAGDRGRPHRRSALTLRSDSLPLLRGCPADHRNTAALASATRSIVARYVMSRNQYPSITPGSVAASHPIDAMVELCPPTVTPRDRETAAAKCLTGVPVSTAMWPAKTARIGNSRRPSACPD